MNTLAFPLWLQNLAALSLQVTLVTAAAAALAWAIRVRMPAARLAYWQMVLLICLVLPAAQPWKGVEPAKASAAAQSEAAPITSQGGVSTAAVPLRFPLGLAALWVLAGGAAIRFVWLLAGFASLRRFRRTSRTLDPLPLPMDRAQQCLGVRADFRVSDRVQGPVTFGIRHPLILLPSRVLEMPDSSQEAIACHELIHVRRRDWAWTAVEEVVLAVFWFHPAIWWLAGRIRLAREQVVDREAVTVIESGQRYVEALLAVAGFDRETLLTPVTLFFEARHLVQRVSSVLRESPTKESNMSKKRLILRVVLGLCAALAVARVSVSLFPLHALVRTAVQADDGRPVQVESGGEFLLHGREIHYPESAVKERVEGLVVAEVTVNAQGQVTDARILSGPEQLRKAVLSSLLEWHFDASKHAAGTSQVAVRFRLPVETEMQRSERPEQEVLELRQAIERDSATTRAYAFTGAGPATGEVLRRRLAERQAQLQAAGSNAEEQARLQREIVEISAALAGRQPSGVISQIRTDGLGDSANQGWMGHLPVHVGDRLDSAKMEQLEKYLHSVDEHLGLRTERDRNGNLAIIIVVRE